MEHWSHTKQININPGIFQSVSLTLLTSLTHIASEVIWTEKGYKTGNKNIIHIYYMDDLKLYNQNDNVLEWVLHSVNDSAMSLG